MAGVEADSVEVVESGGQGGEHGSYVVTVRTPAGFSAEFRVTDAVRVEVLTQRAVAQFTAYGQLGDGNYRLVLVRDGSSTDLVASARLGESGVVAGDVLSLVVMDPQVDG